MKRILTLFALFTLRSATAAEQERSELGETKNLWAEKPDLTATMERRVIEGRSTPGAKQANDVPVRWRRFLRADAPPVK